MRKKCRVVPGSYSPGGNSRVSERGPGVVQVMQVHKQTPPKNNSMCSSCGCSEDGCSASVLCAHFLRVSAKAQENERMRMNLEQARCEVLRPSLETRARALGLISKNSRPSTAALIDEEEQRRFKWATTKKVNRASRTEE